MWWKVTYFSYLVLIFADVKGNGVHSHILSTLILLNISGFKTQEIDNRTSNEFENDTKYFLDEIKTFVKLVDDDLGFNSSPTIVTSTSLSITSLLLHLHMFEIYD